MTFVDLIGDSTSYFAFYNYLAGLGAVSVLPTWLNGYLWQCAAVTSDPRPKLKSMAPLSPVPEINELPNEEVSRCGASLLVMLCLDSRERRHFKLARVTALWAADNGVGVASFLRR